MTRAYSQVFYRQVKPKRILTKPCLDLRHAFSLVCEVIVFKFSLQVSISEPRPVKPPSRTCASYLSAFRLSKLDDRCENLLEFDWFIFSTNRFIFVYLLCAKMFILREWASLFVLFFVILLRLIDKGFLLNFLYLIRTFSLTLSYLKIRRLISRKSFSDESLFFSLSNVF